MRPHPFYFNGKLVEPGPIDDDLYMDYSDISYGMETDLRDTLLWRGSYKDGFVCPNEYRDGWLAFAVTSKNCLFLGTFLADEVFPPELQTWEEFKEEAIRLAERKSPPFQMETLRRIYLDDREKPYRATWGEEMAQDPEVADFIADYWDYVCWNEHGNQASLSELGGYEGMLWTILEPEQYYEYLLPYDDVDERPKQLTARLKKLHKKYARVMSKSKKRRFKWH